MSYAVVARRVACPFCAEPVLLQLDLTAGDQEYIEDCQVCCQPMLLRFSVVDNELETLEVSCSQ